MANKARSTRPPSIGKSRDQIEQHEQDVYEEQLGQQASAGRIDEDELVNGKHPADHEENGDGYDNIDGRSRDRDQQFLPGIGRHSFQARHAADGKQGDVRGPDSKSPGREGVAKLVEQYAEKDQQRKGDPVHRRLRTTISVVNPGKEPKEQKKSQVDSHLYAGNSCYATGPFHASARWPKRPLRQAFSGS